MEKTLSNKKILILGGDALSADIVKYANKMGVYTIVTDWYDTKRSPAKQSASEYWNVSVSAYDELAALIRSNHVDGILTGFTDSYLIHYARLCKKVGLPCYGTEQQFECFTDKQKYKALMRQFGVPTIEQYTVDSPNIRYPVLVKPVDGSGSRGITICHNHKELEEAVEIAKSFSNKQEVIIERYMDGREVTIFWLFLDGEYYLTMIGNRHVKHNQEGNIIPLPVGYTFPASVTTKYREEVEQKAKQMFRSIGIKNGMMFMQCKVENDTCFVYDIGYRLTGSVEYKIQDALFGYNPMEMLIRFAITGKMTEDADISNKIDPIKMQPCYNVSCLCAPGTIKEITGYEQVKEIPGVVDYILSHFPGDTITEQMKGQLTQITVRVLGGTNNREELYQTMQDIQNQIHIVGVDGTNLLLPGIEPKDVENFVL